MKHLNIIWISMNPPGWVRQRKAWRCVWGWGGQEFCCCMGITSPPSKKKHTLRTVPACMILPDYCKCVRFQPKSIFEGAAGGFFSISSTCDHSWLTVKSPCYRHRGKGAGGAILSDELNRGKTIGVVAPTHKNSCSVKCTYCTEYILLL